MYSWLHLSWNLGQLLPGFAIPPHEGEGKVGDRSADIGMQGSMTLRVASVLGW